MIYETNIATTPHDILSKLNSFLSANGWTVDVYEDLGGGDPNRGWRLAVNNGALFFGFRSFVDSDPTVENSTNAFNGISGIACIGYDSFNAASELDQQAGAGPDMSFMQLESDLCDAYHFFTDSASGFIAVVAERTAGKFSALILGQTEQNSRQFYTGTSRRFNKNVDTNTRPLFWWGSEYTNNIRKNDGSWANLGSPMRNSTGNVNQSNLGVPHFLENFGAGVLSRASHTAWAGNALAHVYQYEEDTRQFALSVWRLVDTIPNVYVCNMRTLEPNDIISLGSDQFIVFPILEKATPYAPSAKQLGQGFAILKS